MTSQQIFERASGSVALVLAGSQTSEGLGAIGTAMVVRDSGVLLTAWHLVRNARSLQVRFRNGEVFDNVQLLGVDSRRDVAAIRIAGSRLPVQPLADGGKVSAGDPVTLIANPVGLPWSVSNGVVSGTRMADEVPGTGRGYRLIQYTAPSSPGSSGGVLFDRKGAAVALVVAGMPQGQNLNFAVPLDAVVGLADAAPSKNFANGADLSLPSQTPVAAPVIPSTPKASLDAPERSDKLNLAKDSATILQSFKTMYVDAEGAQHFNGRLLQAELGRHKEFPALNIRIVDDAKLADVVLEVRYIFAWEYPFVLRHQNTSVVLLSGKGQGPFSGPAGAVSVAKEFVKLARPHRIRKD